jgi:hypothetical protein
VDPQPWAGGGKPDWSGCGKSAHDAITQTT